MWCPSRCCGWVALSCLLRLLFTLLNAHAFRGWLCPVTPEPSGHSTTGVEVIIPSLPTSGTTTMQVALETLGLRAYKGDELLFYLPQALDYDLPAEGLIGPFQACGVKAFVSDDFFGLVSKLLKVSPAVKVILTARPWRSWKKAFFRARSGPEEQIFDLVNNFLCNWLPIGLVWPDADAGHSFVKNSMTATFLQNCLIRTREHMIPPNAEKLRLPHHWLLENETYYNEWLDNLRTLVPRDRFMEFDFKRHGWDDLAQFLGRPTPPVGTAFPRTMGGTTSYDILKLQLHPVRYLAFWVLMILSALVHCVALSRLAGVQLFALPRVLNARRGHKQA